MNPNILPSRQVFFSYGKNVHVRPRKRLGNAIKIKVSQTPFLTAHLCQQLIIIFIQVATHFKFFDHHGFFFADLDMKRIVFGAKISSLHCW